VEWRCRSHGEDRYGGSRVRVCTCMCVSVPRAETKKKDGGTHAEASDAGGSGAGWERRGRQ
jgi:hypothetical protein